VKSRLSIKGIAMIRKPAILLGAALLGGCGYTPHDLPDRGMAPVNVPVVTRSDYVFDAITPGGSLLPSEAARLEGWFQGLGLGYGDKIYVDGPYAQAAAGDVARVASNFGMLVSSGAPITPGGVPDGIVRVVVSRNRAIVPNCPNWGRVSDPNYQNRSGPNFGCAVNANLAAMIANPEDLVQGREGSGVIDPRTGTKAVDTYRAKAPSGAGALPAVSSKGN